jgi:Tfp pilus assembly protein PilO
MKNLSKDKRNRIILIVVVGVAVIAGLWFGVIKAQKVSLTDYAERIAKAQKRVADAKRRVARAEEIQTDLEQATKKLAAIEDGMAPADKYAWFIQTVNEFKVPYRIEKLNYSREQLGDVKLIPGFPYKAATFKVQGVAHYHDLGKFIADFENAFPYISLQNLQLERQQLDLSSATNAEDLERLAFKLDIVTLVKPTMQ